MVSKCFLGDLKKREIYIIGSSKKKNTETYLASCKYSFSDYILTKILLFI